MEFVSTMSARTIDEVIDQLGDVIAEARRERSRIGYFPALYRQVTIKVKEGIQTGLFDNGPRMERLDVAFANMYLDALAQFRRDERPASCWLAAFEAARGWRPLILQHLLLGMNAHINYDLGIAAATVCLGEELPTLQNDFNVINGILSGMVKQVVDEINSVSPWISWLDHIEPNVNDAVIHFSMDRARECAWNVATRLAALDRPAWAADLALLDDDISALGRLVRRPGALMSAGLLLIRLRESSNVPKVIDVLSQTAAAGLAGPVN